MEDEVLWTEHMTNPTLTLTKKVMTCMMTHEQIQQMFSEVMMNFWVLNKYIADFSESYKWVRLQGGLLVLKIGAYHM